MKRKKPGRTQSQDYDSEFFRNRADRAERHEEYDEHRPTPADARRWQEEWESEQYDWDDEDRR